MSNIIIDSFRFGSDSPVTPSLGYGLLYNWYAATDARGVAPSGFRVPCLADMNTLIAEVDTLTGGGKLKSQRDINEGDPYWNAPNTGATNILGFNGYGSGLRSGVNGVFFVFRQNGYSLSIDASDSANAIFLLYLTGSEEVSTGTLDKHTGTNIRCVSDTEPATALVQDADGNNYSWVQIGSQYWLVQSLKTTKYNNGDSIVTGLDNAAWAATTDGAWAYPNGDSSLPI